MRGESVVRLAAGDFRFVTSEAGIISSNERYEPAIFPHGDWFGIPEQGFDIGATYL